jgi:predicted GNAT family acetyltransferase
MSWTTTEDLEEYLGAAGAFLAAQRVRNTLPLTIAESLRVRGPGAYGSDPPLFGCWRPRGGEVEAAFLVTPPFPVVATALPAPAVPALVDLLLDGGRRPSGVNAEAGTAEAVAAAWAARTGGGWQVHQHQLLHRLDTLVAPSPEPSGAARVPSVADTDLLVAWWEEFAREAGDWLGDTAVLVADKLAHGGFVLWEDGGAPVALAGMTRVVAGMARVGPVYTPPRHRRRGYAAGATTAVSVAAREAGAAEVLLFTDLANPTSNALYRRLGYQPVEDRLVLTFPDEDGPERRERRDRT